MKKFVITVLTLMFATGIGLAIISNSGSLPESSEKSHTMVKLVYTPR